MRKPVNLAVLGIVLIAGLATYFQNTRAPKPKPVSLTFIAQHNDETFEFDVIKYQNPGGAGQYGLRDFRFFVSNVILASGDAEHVVADSYHLIRFDRHSPEFTVQLPPVPLQNIDKISFSIGLDPAANGSAETRGDVDPNSRMAWNWAIGYKFLLAEGDLVFESDTQPLVYHIGFDENRRDVTFSSPKAVRNDGTLTLPIHVDIARLFKGPTTFNMRDLSTIKMHKGDAAKMAENYAKILRVNWPTEF